MLSSYGLTAVSQTMKYGCFLNILPYKWDSKTYQLSLPRKPKDTWLHKLHCLYMFILGITCGARFLYYFLVKDLPGPFRVFHVGWSMGYLLTNLCFLQFHLEKTAIMNFSNQLFKYIIVSRKGAYISLLFAGA